jgi:outer membrane lipoprotein-sorting protein
LLTAKKSDAAYPQRRIWVDRERFSILKEELFSRSGKLLKTTTLEIEFDAVIPGALFSKASLKK